MIAPEPGNTCLHVPADALHRLLARWRTGAL